jgi:DNA ligase-3
MADSVDLIVLGAYFGTGNKGGLMSVFLMGCYDEESKSYKTVCKVGNGFNDDEINKLQKKLDVVKISGNYDKVPKWLDVDRSLVPDFVTNNPKK